MGLCGSTEQVAACNEKVIDLSHFDVLRIVGEGGFGKVQLVTKLSEGGGDKGKNYAMKTMSKKVACNRKMTAEFFNERDMLAALQHDFLCNAQYCFQDENNCYIVMDICLGGDLKYMCLHPPAGEKGCISNSLARFYVTQVIVALDYIHHMNILHRDIKPDNVVLCSDGYVRVTDFGISQKVDGNKQYKGSSGTHGYMPPECYGKNRLQSFTADWFALGCTVVYLVTGEMPFDMSEGTPARDKDSEFDDWRGVTTGFHKFKIGKGKNDDKKEDDLSPECRDFLEKLCNLDPEKRLQGPDVIGHPWIQQGDVVNIIKKTVTPPFMPDCDRANCEVNQADVMNALCGPEKVTIAPEDVVTEEEQALFKNYEFNVDYPSLLEGRSATQHRRGSQLTLSGGAELDNYAKGSFLGNKDKKEGDDAAAKADEGKASEEAKSPEPDADVNKIALGSE